MDLPLCLDAELCPRNRAHGDDAVQGRLGQRDEVAPLADFGPIFY